MSRNLSGLRPALPALPPTLEPQAILAMAPPRDRRLSLLWALTIYSGLFAAAYHTTRFVETRKEAGVRQDFRLVEPIDRPPDPPPAAAIPAPAAVPTPAARTSETFTPARVMDTVPLDVPRGLLPSVDHSGDGQSPDPGILQPPGRGDGTFRVPGTIEDRAPAHPSVVNVEFKDMTVLTRVDPVYPRLCQLGRIQGEVVVLMTVDALGVPVEVRTVSSPNGVLQAEAERVARQWRFKAASLDGRAVASQFRLTFNFRLH